MSSENRMDDFVENPGEGTIILSDLAANPSLLLHWIGGEFRNLSSIESVLPFKPDSVVLPFRLRDLV